MKELSLIARLPRGRQVFKSTIQHFNKSTSRSEKYTRQLSFNDNCLYN